MGKAFGLFGFPLEHSFSPRYFADKFAALGLNNYRYYVIPCERFTRETIESALQQDPELCGFNITLPHKRSVLDFLDEIDPFARLCGSVNTLKVRKEGSKFYIKGFNTDQIGFQLSFLPWISGNRLKALVLGSGGSSLAVQLVLRNAGIEFMVASRNHPGTCSYEDLTEVVIRAHQAIINTTPLGMFPKPDEAPLIPYSGIGPHHFCFDLVYNPAETLFLKKARQQGARVKNGLEMLHLQADASFEIWETDF